MAVVEQIGPRIEVTRELRREELLEAQPGGDGHLLLLLAGDGRGYATGKQTDYRGGDWTLMNTPSDSGLVTAIDDGLAVVDHVAGLPYVDPSRISLYGVSLGGNLVLYLISERPAFRAAVLGAPAPIWFLGANVPVKDGRRDLAGAELDVATVTANIAPIRTPRSATSNGL